MEHPYWSELLSDVLPGRVAKPRISGLTMVIDTGIPIGMMRDVLQLCAEHIDFWKLGFGSASVCPPEAVLAKVTLCQEYGVLAYPGGTSLEVAVTQGIWKDYLASVHQAGIHVIEVSDGTIQLPAAERREIIRTARKLGFTVVTEVGKKLEGMSMSPRKLAQMAQSDLHSGAEYVIIEGREGGRGVGVFDAAGNVDEQAVHEIVSLLGPLATRVIWESPLISQQTYYIREFGNKVNLGNIKPLDVIALESLRRGFRSDTLRLSVRPSPTMEQDIDDEVGTGWDGQRIGEESSRPTLWTDSAFSPSPARRRDKGAS